MLILIFKKLIISSFRQNIVSNFHGNEYTRNESASKMDGIPCYKRQESIFITKLSPNNIHFSNQLKPLLHKGGTNGN